MELQPHIYSMTIVSDLQKLQPAFFNKNFEGGRASINSILDELLQSMDRSNNDLSGRDFVDNIWIECL